jgi:hypothetical protein
MRTLAQSTVFLASLLDVRLSQLRLLCSCQHGWTPALQHRCATFAVQYPVSGVIAVMATQQCGFTAAVVIGLRYSAAQVVHRLL